VPINRDTVLKTAEKLLRAGRLVRDLYVRGGSVDRAAVQYVRFGDNLFDEGFLPNAAALYKKALKVHDHQHTHGGNVVESAAALHAAAHVLAIAMELEAHAADLSHGLRMPVQRFAQGRRAAPSGPSGEPR